MSDSPYTYPAAQTPSNGAALHPQALTDRLAQGAHLTIDRLAEATALHLQQLEEAVTTAGVQLKNQARQAREASDEWVERLRTTVRRNPLTAVPTALAIGAPISRVNR